MNVRCQKIYPEVADRLLILELMLIACNIIIINVKSPQSYMKLIFLSLNKESILKVEQFHQQFSNSF